MGKTPSQPPSLSTATTSTVSLSQFSVSTSVPRFNPEEHVILRISLQVGSLVYKTYAMLDSGASANFIDGGYAKAISIPLVRKPQPLQLEVVDGRAIAGGQVTHHTVSTNLAIDQHKESTSFHVTTLGHYPVILGVSWLKKHDPVICWSEHTLTFKSRYCLSSCLSEAATVTAMSEYPRNLRQVYVPPSSAPMTSSKTRNRTPGLNVKSMLRQKSVPVSNLRTSTAPVVSLVNATAFAQVLNTPGTEIYQISFSETPAQSGVHAMSAMSVTPVSSAMPSSDPDLTKLPKEYHEFADVFSKKEAEKLPEHRKYDHHIPLQEGTTPPFGPVYSLSPRELEVLQKYIDDNLRKGFIKHSQSPCGAPILFVKKPDGNLRLCVDYRGLNKITIKNRYPLPLIGELLDRVGKAKYFTKFDLRDGYYLLRMRPGEEWKTAFRCRYGLYEYSVMPFGLCNAPASFQHLTNDVFREFLDDFLVVYLDDLLIYSNTLEEHKNHVRQVLDRLRSAGLYVKPEKSQFHVQEVTFLGFIISPEGIHMDPAKVMAVTSWPVPESVHDIQVFLGFANFYRRFIKTYSKIVTPITMLLKKNSVFKWTEAAQEAFERLKTAFSTGPILRHFDRSKPVVLETDASDFALGGVLSQRDENGILHPCAFYSRKFNAAEMNYEIYDKEMLAIVNCMEHWRHYLEGLEEKITILTDHKNLLWFTETKVYNRRQARWAEQLTRFDFVIKFRPGVKSGKPDALSRRPDYSPLKEGGTIRIQHEYAFLKPNQIDVLDETAPHFKISELAATAIDIDNDLAKAITAALPLDADIGPHLKYLQDLNLPRDDDTAKYLEHFTLRNNIVLYKDLIYVPDDDALKVRILRSCHDTPIAGHFGQAKTLELVSRNYYWPRIRQYVNEYIRSCDTCARNKVPRHKPYGPLQPLPIPPAPWSSVSMDFIVELPLSKGFDSILVCVDRLTKMAHFCPTTTHVSAEDTADLYLRYVFKNHGLPSDIVTDRGTQFTSKFSTRLYNLCDIKSNKSTAYHPQSDGQTERVNQILEQYLRIFCDYQQDDWYQLLPLAEFAYNNAQHSATQVSPFYANYGYHPRCMLKVNTSAQSSVNPSAEQLIDKIKIIHEQIRTDLAKAQEKYKGFYDNRVKEAPSFNIGDFVWLSRKNITTTRPTAKLDYKRLGPFKIIDIVGESKLAFKLDLPPRMKIHPVFHVSLLEPYHANTIPGRTQPPPPPVTIEDEVEYEVDKILDSKIERNKVKYLISWKGYGPHEHTWEPAESLEHASNTVTQYHIRYPNRPGPKDLESQPRSQS